jgi:hypothetical protein
MQPAKSSAEDAIPFLALWFCWFLTLCTMWTLGCVGMGVVVYATILFPMVLAVSVYIVPMVLILGYLTWLLSVLVISNPGFSDFPIVLWLASNNKWIALVHSLWSLTALTSEHWHCFAEKMTVLIFG